MDIRVFKVVSAFLAAGISVSAIGMQECGSTSEVSLQSPSLIGPNAVPFEELYSPALDIEETGIVPLSRGNVTVDINDYTFIANTTFSDVVQGYGMDPEDPIIYDGGIYWISGATVCIASGEGESNQDVGLNTGDTIIRVSYTREWSLVKLEDGTQGYVRNSFLSADEVELEPIEVATPTPTPEPTNTPTPTPAPSSDSGSSETPTPEPEETEAEPEPTEEPSEPEEEFHEAAVDYTVYASCALNTRTGPGISYTCLSTLAVGTPIEVVAVTDNGWYKSADGFYVKASLTMDTAPTPTPAPAPTNSGGGGGSSSSSSSTYMGDTSSDFATFVRSFIGCRYVYGGSSPSTGFDCSGFVMYCYSTYYGITLPHGATSQSSRGYEVDPSDIQVGDIICFDRDGDGTMEHSAIYVGNDTYVHAQSSATGVVASTYSSATGIAHIRRVL